MTPRQSWASACGGKWSNGRCILVFGLRVDGYVLVEIEDLVADLDRNAVEAHEVPHAIELGFVVPCDGIHGRHGGGTRGDGHGVERCRGCKGAQGTAQNEQTNNVSQQL